MKNKILFGVKYCMYAFMITSLINVMCVNAFNLDSSGMSLLNPMENSSLQPVFSKLNELKEQLITKKNEFDKTVKEIQQKYSEMPSATGDTPKRLREQIESLTKQQRESKEQLTDLKEQIKQNIYSARFSISKLRPATKREYVEQNYIKGFQDLINELDK